MFVVHQLDKKTFESDSNYIVPMCRYHYSFGVDFVLIELERLLKLSLASPLVWIGLKRTVHPTHQKCHDLLVVPYTLSAKHTHTTYIFKNVGNPSDWSPLTFKVFFILRKSMGTSNCLVTHIFQNIFLYVQQKTETHTGLEHAGE